ncbi:MAG: hypothetical protein JST80_10805 [Bdellovibrionales bacterium]|nr:hypothetical protein [Bdellovibrionales bacterium]
MKFKLWLRIAFVFATFSTQFTTAKAEGTEKFYENASSNNALLNLLKNTKKTLDIEIYQMDDQDVHAALRAALARGVKIRIIQEPRPAGGGCLIFSSPVAADNPGCVANKKLIADVRKAGGTYVPFNKELCGKPNSNCFEHGKMVISDNQYVLLSTGNFNSTNLCNAHFNPAKCNRDYSVLTWDPGSVRTLATIFAADLKSVPYDLGAILASNEAAKITVSPYSMKPLVEFIRSAKQLIQVQNQYLKDPELNQALMEAAQRGIKVYVQTASICAFGRPSASEGAAWTRIYTLFDQSKVQTRAFTQSIKVGGRKGYLHAKAILVDSVRAWVGSVNGSTTSITDNREYGIFINDEVEALKLGGFMKSDFLDPGAETWKESLQCKKDFGRGEPNGGAGLY